MGQAGGGNRSVASVPNKFGSESGRAVPPGRSSRPARRHRASSFLRSCTVDLEPVGLREGDAHAKPPGRGAAEKDGWGNLFLPQMNTDERRWGRREAELLCFRGGEPACRPGRRVAPSGRIPSSPLGFAAAGLLPVRLRRPPPFQLRQWDARQTAAQGAKHPGGDGLTIQAELVRS
jgi:hypothetical protein